MTSTEDRILLDSIAKKKQDERHDNVLVNRATTLADSVAKNQSKIQKARIISEKQFEYYTSQIDLQEEKFEKEKSLLEEELKAKLDNLEKGFENLKRNYWDNVDKQEKYYEQKIAKVRTICDQKIEYFKKQMNASEDNITTQVAGLEREIERKENRVISIAKQIKTKKGKESLDEEVKITEEKKNEEDISDEQKARKLCEGNHNGYWIVAQKYPKVHKKWEEENRQREKERLQSPEYIARKNEAENEVIAEKVRQAKIEEEKTRMIGQANLIAKNIEKQISEERAKGASAERIQELKEAYYLAMDEVRDLKNRLLC